MYRVDMSQRPHQILRGLVNFDNKTDFTEKQLTFNSKGASALSKKDANKYDRNSRVMAKFHGIYTGERHLIYNRIDLNYFFGPECALAPHGEHVMNYELLEYVRRDLGIDIEKDEILHEWIDQEASFVEIKVKSNSLTYLGSVIVFFEGSPDSLVARVPNLTLDGFHKENVTEVTADGRHL